MAWDEAVVTVRHCYRVVMPTRGCMCYVGVEPLGLA